MTVGGEQEGGRVTHWLPRAWNGTNSLLGLLGAAGGTACFLPGEAVWEVAGGWLIGLLGRAGWANAITLGDVVLYADRGLIPLLHHHEMEHIRQGRRWGPLFLPAYVLESVYQWLRTGRGYQDSRFEVAARRAAGDGEEN